MRIDSVVEKSPGNPSEVQRRCDGEVAATAGSSVAKEGAPVNGEAEVRLRKVGEALGKRVGGDEREGRCADGLSKRVELEQDGEAAGELGSEECEGGRDTNFTACDRAGAGALDLRVDVAIEQVVDGAASASQELRLRLC